MQGVRSDRARLGFPVDDPGRGVVDFLARLAALLPRSRSQLIRYQSVKLRASGPSPCGLVFSCSKSRPAMTRMQRLQSVYDTDISVCPDRGGALKVLARDDRDGDLRRNPRTRRET